VHCHRNNSVILQSCARPVRLNERLFIRVVGSWEPKDAAEVIAVSSREAASPPSPPRSPLLNRAPCDARGFLLFSDTSDRSAVIARNFAELMHAVVVDRDRHAYAHLFRYFAPIVNEFFLRRGMETADANDLTQIVMMKVWECTDEFDREKFSVTAWIFSIARHCRIDHDRTMRL
jgi:hypothetical protein